MSEINENRGLILNYCGKVSPADARQFICLLFIQIAHAHSHRKFNKPTYILDKKNRLNENSIIKVINSQTRMACSKKRKVHSYRFCRLFIQCLQKSEIKPMYNLQIFLDIHSSCLNYALRSCKKNAIT